MTDLNACCCGDPNCTDATGRLIAQGIDPSEVVEHRATIPLGRPWTSVACSCGMRIDNSGSHINEVVDER